MRPEPTPLAAEIRAFLQAARRMEERGDLDGALELYRQALELAQSDPALGSMAREIALTLQEMEIKRRAIQPPPAAVVVGQVGNLPYAEAAGPGVRASRPQRKRPAWGWIAGLVGLAALATLGLFLLPTLRPTPTTPTLALLAPAGTPYPRPAVAIAPGNAEQVAQLAR